MNRTLKYCRAIHEALDMSLAHDRSVYVIGLGVPDPKGVFDTTVGLQEKYGPNRVMDMPSSENGMTGIVIGSAIAGMRPVMVHQRMDFAIMSFDTLVNQAAKWHYMFGGKGSVPMVVRMIVGRGWGQGAQHSQSLQSWLAHIPGLKVIMPATPYDAKGMLISAIQDNNPVISIEHRWLYNIEGPVPQEMYSVPIGKARVIRPGKDVTVVAASHMTIEAVRAANLLAEQGVDTEVIDLRSLRPLDAPAIVESVTRTGRLVVADTGWKPFGVGAEIIAIATEQAFGAMKAPPVRVGMADCPSPCTPALAKYFFPTIHDVVSAVRKVMNLPPLESPAPRPGDPLSDVPDNHFTGPF